MLHAMEAHGGERRYSSYSYLTSALDRGEWSASCPGRALPQGKGPPVPIGQEAGWAPVVHSIVSHYTDIATPALSHL
jgi:hypothetical protein